MFKEPSLKKKEYLVQITIIEARHLAAKDDGSSNPFVKMSCFDLPVQVSEVQDKKLNPVWNQSFTFSGLELNDQEFQTAELQFQVLSKNNFSGNDLIGEYAINLSTLYKNANHEYYNVWLCLTNPEFDEDADTTQGYLLVDCFIIGEGDRPPVHSINDKLNTDVEEDDEEFSVDNLNFDQLREYQEKKMGIQVLGKPSVARKAFQLSCYVFKADGLIDFPGFYQPQKPVFFVSCRSMGLVQRTKAVGDNSAPLINQKMLFPTYFPFLNDKIVMRCWNYQKGGRDKFIASIPEFSSSSDFFNISKLMSMGGRMPAKWINLYGIPPTERNDYISGGKRKQPLSGTAFLGRVLISFSLLANPQPRYEILPCNPFYDPDTVTYRLFCDIYEVKFLKDYDIQVWCECTIGIYSTGPNKKKKPQNKKNSISLEWKNEDKYNDICLPAIVQNFPKDIASIPDIFINLYTSSGTNKERIGYCRLKTEQVMGWEPTPRWLQFNSLDMDKDSPGSVLVNLQFLLDTENTKRVFKQKGVSSLFTVYAHIVSGFELDSKNGDENLETYIDVEINGISKQTVGNKGHFPFWNELLEIDKVELDQKLDFAPNICVTLYKKMEKSFLGSDKFEPIGNFTIPIHCCKKNKYLPHYFNFIKNNECVGRVLALFYIHPEKDNKLNKPTFEIYDSLKNNMQTSNVYLSVLGLRNLENEINRDDIDFTVSITQDDNKYKPQISGLRDELKQLEQIKQINNEEKETVFNLLQNFSFNDVKIYGDSNFQIFPMMKISYIRKSFFGDQEKYLLFNLCEFSNTISERTKKKYKLMFECNLGYNKVEQMQYILLDAGDKVYEKKEDKGMDNDYEDDDEVQGPSKDEMNKKLIEMQEDEDENTFDEKLDKKMVVKLETYKNCFISDLSDIVCMPDDKTKEREIKKSLRKKIFMEMKQYKRMEILSEKDSNKLLDLNTKYRELKKPLMNEDIFFDFDDIADEYDYGREIYTEDIYETHPDLKVPYQSMKMYHIPSNVFEKKYEMMEGYFKLGKVTDTVLKFSLKLQFNEVDSENQKELLKEEAKRDKKNKKNKKNIDNENQEAQNEEEFKKEFSKFDLFDTFVNQRFRNVYANKICRKTLRKDEIAFPMNSVVVRVYILRALNLTAQDNFASIENILSGFSSYCKANSYLEIMLGHKYDSDDSKQIKYVNDIVNYKESTLNPSFFKLFELEGDLPIDWKLTINVRSKKEGGIGKGSLIGSTSIDIEDRYIGESKNLTTLLYKSYEDYLNYLMDKSEFGEDQQISDKLSTLSSKMEGLNSKQIPVEYRPLYHPDKKTAQGMLEMFVEVMSNHQAKIIKPSKIEPPAPQEFELRLVLWECNGLPLEKKKAISVYLTCSYKPEGWLSKVSIYYLRKLKKKLILIQVFKMVGLFIIGE